MPRTSLTEHERQLLLSNAIGAFTTLRENGTPHTTPTWVDVDGDIILVNTASRVKQNSIRRDPRVCMMVVSTDNPMVYLTVEGSASLAIDDGWAHADRLSYRYRRVPHPRTQGVNRYIVRITPLRVQSVGLAD